MSTGFGSGAFFDGERCCTTSDILVSRSYQLRRFEKRRSVLEIGIKAKLGFEVVNFLVQIYEKWPTMKDSKHCEEGADRLL